MLLSLNQSEEFPLQSVINACDEFFNLREEEKEEFEGKYVLDPIRCGTSFNVKADKVFSGGDFLKVFVHPEFHFPDKPTGFRYKLNCC